MTQCAIVNNGKTTITVKLTDGSEKSIQPSQYVLYNGDAEVTRVDGGLADIYDLMLSDRVVPEKKKLIPWETRRFLNCYNIKNISGRDMEFVISDDDGVENIILFRKDEMIPWINQDDN